ncbi:MAG TPA: AGE family epimerase/isomerase, partial [Bacteroidales bacterium]|nr:AGE family epimerase/isomerase [Bacteroidales bacterium]
MKTTDYSRREFLAKSSLGGLGLLTAANTSGCRRDFERSSMTVGQRAKIDTLGGMTLEQLRDQYRAELFDNFIPNMDRYAIDHEYGGVMCSMDIRTGELENMNKTAWYVGRGLWVYSYMYNNLEKNARFLEIAARSKDLLLKIQPADGSFWTESFTREGVPLSGPGDIYGSLFVAEGLSEYAEASGEKQYRIMAKKIIFDCVRRYDQPDYSYSIGSYLKNSPAI